MNVINVIGKRIASTGEKAKNMTEVSSLRKKIRQEEQRLQEIYAEIGKKYYEERENDLTNINFLCEDIDTRLSKIARVKKKINMLCGVKTCEKCGAEVDNKFSFCGVCGAALPITTINDYMSDEENMTDDDISINRNVKIIKNFNNEQNK